MVSRDIYVYTYLYIQGTLRAHNLAFNFLTASNRYLDTNIGI